MKYLVQMLGASIFENKEVEYKYKLENQTEKIEKWAKTLVAFANTEGGTLFVGVKDDGEIVGLARKEVDETKNLILKSINRYIFPHIGVKFETINYEDDLFILSVLVNPSNDIVIYKSGDYNEKVYIREDGSSVVANVNQILTLGKRKLGTDNEVLNEQYQRNNYHLLQGLAKKYGKTHVDLTTEYLISKEVLNKDGRVTQGLKMFSDNYDNEDTLTVCRLWNGYTKGVDKIIDKKEFKGSLCKVFTDTMEFIIRNSRSGLIKLPDGSRIDTVSYPEQALREAIINALAHRDYSINGTQIDIDIYKDRLEITSPGKWMLSKKPEEYKMYQIPSVRRNKVICNCFEVIGLMEKSGSGISKIYQIYQDLKGKVPLLEDNSDFFTITLYDLLCDDLDIVTNSKYDSEILSYCYNIARTRDEILDHLNIKNRNYLRTILNPLIESNLILLTAPKKSKNVKYITNNNMYKK